MRKFITSVLCAIVVILVIPNIGNAQSFDQVQEINIGDDLKKVYKWLKSHNYKIEVKTPEEITATKFTHAKPNYQPVESRRITFTLAGIENPEVSSVHYTIAIRDIKQSHMIDFYFKEMWTPFENSNYELLDAAIIGWSTEQYYRKKGQEIIHHVFKTIDVSGEVFARYNKYINKNTQWCYELYKQ